MENTLEASIELIDEKLHFRGGSPGQKKIEVDYVPPPGSRKGHTPMELFLLSLAACAGSTVASLLRKTGTTIQGLRVHATGKRSEMHPTVFESAKIAFEIFSPDADSFAVEKAIALSEKKYCPIWAMIKGNVTVETGYCIQNGK